MSLSLSRPPPPPSPCIVTDTRNIGQLEGCANQIGKKGSKATADVIRSLRELENKWCGHGAEWMFLHSVEWLVDRNKKMTACWKF